MKLVLALVLSVLELTIFGVTENNAAEPSNNLVELAKTMAEQEIAPFLAANAPSQGQFRVGIFCFANRDGKYEKMEMGLLGPVIQGELESKLRPALSQAAPAKFSVLTAFPGMKDAFAQASLDPQGVYSGGVAGARSILQLVNIQVGIVGRFDFVKPKDIVSDIGSPESSVKLSVTVILPNTEKSFDVQVLPKDILDLSGSSTTPPPGQGGLGQGNRFNVEIFAKKPSSPLNSDGDDTTWEKLTLQVATNPDSAFFNVHFLILKPEMKGRRYKVRLTNKGPKANEVGDNWPNSVKSLYRNRLAGAALLIDGVNSFYQDTGIINPATNASTIGPVVRHPATVTKWVLSGAGTRLVPAQGNVVSYPPPISWKPSGSPFDAGPVGPAVLLAERRLPALGLQLTQRLKNGQFVPDSGAGGSIVDVRGFQKSAELADSFVFSDPAGSIAESVGITNDMGMIAVHFYLEDLPAGGAPAPQASIIGGTAPGPEIQNAVFKVLFGMEPNPEEVWRIFYRYEGSEPSGLDLQPTT